MKKTIKRELPAVGTELFHFYYGKPVYKARIIKDESQTLGKAVEYKGKKFGTLTGAAVSITQKSTNGWVFWRLEK